MIRLKKTTNIILFIFIIFLYHISKESNMLLLTMSFSMYLVFYSLLSGVTFLPTFEKYHREKKYYIRDKILKLTFLFVTIIGSAFSLVSYFIGHLINIDYLSIINALMSISLTLNILIKITSNYLEVINYKKIALNLQSLCNIAITLVAAITSLFTFQIFKVKDYLAIIFLYLPSIIIPIIFLIIIYLFIIKKKITKSPKKEKTSIKYLPIITSSLFSSSSLTIYNLVKSSYIYFSIIILYYTLLNRYNYDFASVSKYITDTYFYGLFILYFLFLIIKKTYQDDLEQLKNKIAQNDEFTPNYFNNLINKVIRVGLSLSIILSVISGPLNYLLFGPNSNFLFSLFPLLAIFILYDTVITISLIITKEKSLTLNLISGLIIKLLFDIPLIATIYRMGYSLVLGSLTSTILGLLVSITISLFTIHHKLKISFLSNFNNLLSIIYENIILCFILVLFTLVVKVTTSTYLSSILVTIFYLTISIVFFTIKKILLKK